MVGVMGADWEWSMFFDVDRIDLLVLEDADGCGDVKRGMCDPA